MLVCTVGFLLCFLAACGSKEEKLDMPTSEEREQALQNLTPEQRQAAEEIGQQMRREFPQKEEE